MRGLLSCFMISILNFFYPVAIIIWASDLVFVDIVKIVYKKILEITCCLLALSRTHQNYI